VRDDRSRLDSTAACYLLCHRYCLRGALYLAGPAYYASVIVDNHRLLAFVSGDILELEYCDGADIDADRVTVTFRVVDCDIYHDFTPAKVVRVLRFRVISSWFEGRRHIL